MYQDFQIFVSHVFARTRRTLQVQISNWCALTQNIIFHWMHFFKSLCLQSPSIFFSFVCVPLLLFNCRRFSKFRNLCLQIWFHVFFISPHVLRYPTQFILSFGFPFNLTNALANTMSAWVACEVLSFRRFWAALSGQACSGQALRVRMLLLIWMPIPLSL